MSGFDTRCRQDGLSIEHFEAAHVYVKGHVEKSVVPLRTFSCFFVPLLTHFGYTSSLNLFVDETGRLKNEMLRKKKGKSISRRGFTALAAAFAVIFTSPTKRAFASELTAGTIDGSTLSASSEQPGAKTVLWFSPHQDDEILTYGSGIIEDLDAGCDVHVILCTDGSKSNVRNVLANNRSCTVCSKLHTHHLSERQFIEARDAEFTESCIALGVPPENIHIYGADDGNVRAVDSSLRVSESVNIISHYLGLYPGAAVRTMSPLTGPRQHRDHKALGQAAVAMQMAGAIGELDLYVEPYYYFNYLATGAPKLEGVACRDSLRFEEATSAYRRFDPEHGRYAIGGHSMISTFKNDEIVETGRRYRSMLDNMTRYAGETRYDTMKSAVLANWGRSDYAVIASGMNYCDALAASGLAGHYRAPIILTMAEALSEQAAECLRTLRVKKAFVVGGEKAVSPKAYSAIGKICSVERITGINRDDTARAISRKLHELCPGDTCIVASGAGFADALSIAPLAYANKLPVFLTTGKTLSDATAAEIKAAGYKKMLIVGGDKVVSPSVASQCSIPEPKRLSGATRYDTCAAVVDYEIDCGMELSGFTVCTGNSFPDALVAGACAGMRNSVVLLACNKAAQIASILKLLEEHKVQVGAGEGGYACQSLGGDKVITAEALGTIMLAATT